MVRARIPNDSYGDIAVVPLGYAGEDSTAEVVIPRPSTGYPKDPRAGRTIRVATLDGTTEYTFTRWRALVRVVDADGNDSMVRRWRPTKAGAKEAAKEAALAKLDEYKRKRADDALRRDEERAEQARKQEEERLAEARGDVTTTVADLVDQYLATPRFAGLATKTQQNYQYAAQHIRDHAVGPMLPRQIDVAVVRRFLADMADTHGSGGAKHARAVLRSAVDMAIGVPDLRVPVNPVIGAREAIPDKQVRPRQIDTSRAPTDAEVAALLSGLTRDPRARAQYPGTARQRSRSGHTGEVVNGLDVADLSAVMFATGARIGEVSALRWSDYDQDRRTISISGTVVSVTGTGTFRQARTKTEGSTRIVPLAKWANAALARRARRFGVQMDDLPDLPIFPSPQHHDRYRDQANLARAVRELFTKHGIDFARGHSARKWRVTSLAERGIPTHKIADLVGHGDIKTTLTYLGRGRQTDEDVIAALDR